MSFLKIFAVLFLILLAEFYCFIAVRMALRNVAPAVRYSVITLYVLINIASWAGFFILRNHLITLPESLKTYYIALAMGWFVAKLLIFIFMLGDDFRRVIQYGMNSLKANNTKINEVQNATKGIKRSVFINRTALALGAGVVLSFMKGISNRYRYQVKKIKLKSAKIPTAFNGLKIVQLSDIHSGSFDDPEAVQRGVQMAMDLKPDVILFTGDLVNYSAQEMNSTYQAIFAQLKAPLGVYSVLGNHDYGDYIAWPSTEAKTANLERLKEIQKNMGWRLLMNEHVLLEKNNAQIAILGIENWGAKAHFPKYGDMKRAYQGLEEKNIPFKILLSHDPSHWNAEVRKKYKDIDLTLSGHTHGMQFGIEIPGFKWSPIQYLYKQWAGLYQEEQQYIYVNRGFGFLGYKGRVGILPEITLIELEA